MASGSPRFRSSVTIAAWLARFAGIGAVWILLLSSSSSSASGVSITRRRVSSRAGKLCSCLTPRVRRRAPKNEQDERTGSSKTEALEAAPRKLTTAAPAGGPSPKPTLERSTSLAQGRLNVGGAAEEDGRGGGNVHSDGTPKRSGGSRRLLVVDAVGAQQQRCADAANCADAGRAYSPSSSPGDKENRRLPAESREARGKPTKRVSLCIDGGSAIVQPGQESEKERRLRQGRAAFASSEKTGSWRDQRPVAVRRPTPPPRGTLLEIIKQEQGIALADSNNDAGRENDDRVVIKLGRVRLVC